MVFGWSLQGRKGRNSPCAGLSEAGGLPIGSSDRAPRTFSTLSGSYASQRGQLSDEARLIKLESSRGTIGRFTDRLRRSRRCSRQREAAAITSARTETSSERKRCVG